MSGIVVERPGPLTTFQDAGRGGWQHLGVPASGAADRGAYRRANALAGNAPGAVVLETTLSGPALRFDVPAVVAICGARSAATVDGRPVPFDEPFAVRAGELLVVGRATRGLRSVIAVRGGLAVTPVLGSASTDTLTGLGPPPLAAGDRLTIGHAAAATPGAGAPAAPAAGAGGPLELTIGPRDDRFDPAAIALLTTATFTVGAASNRIGVRLDGPRLEHRGDLPELRSEGIVAGSIQVPPGGRPLLLLRDHPATGGYPVIGVLTDAAIDRAAQLRPGADVCLTRAGRPLADCRADAR